MAIPEIKGIAYIGVWKYGLYFSTVATHALKRKNNGT
jgi:hypothetical protein